jgi:hypothetical protein
VYAINPLAVARYRERHSAARSKSDHADAMTLGNILRVDAHLHRRLPVDSELCQAIAVLARAHQDAIWARTKAHHQLRSLLREFYPTFLAAFTGRFPLGIASPEARAVLAIALTPAVAATLSVSRIAAALRRAGRSRGIAEAAAEIKAGLRKSQLRQQVQVETAMGKHALALLAALDTARANVDELGQASAELFRTHPDYDVITSFPGLADSTGARVLAEIGDDRIRPFDFHYAPSHQKQPTGQRRLDVGLLGRLHLRASPAALPPAPRARRPPRPGQPPPVQQTPRPALPLPTTPTDLSRSQGIPTAMQRRGLIRVQQGSGRHVRQLANRDWKRYNPDQRKRQAPTSSKECLFSLEARRT